MEQDETVDMRDIRVEPAGVEIGYGYVIRMPLDDWREIAAAHGDPYISNTVEDYADVVDELVDSRIGIHLDSSQLADLWQTIADIDCPRDA